MPKPRRARMALHPVDDLARIARLLSADAAPNLDTLFMDAASNPHVRQVASQKVWLITADDVDAGVVVARPGADSVHIACVVAEGWRGRGVAKGAIGRFLGLREWPDVAELHASFDRDNAAAAVVARATGFTHTGTSDEGREVWTRAVPAPMGDRTGPQRYLRASGLIDRYPTDYSERVMLLSWVGDQVLAPGEVLPERAFTERLASWADDPVLLRRHLVDHEVVERTRSGSEYALVGCG